jgi:hypothetical protein
MKNIKLQFGLWLILALIGVVGWSCPALAATLTLSPSTGNYTTQNNITVSIEVNTNQAINGVEGILRFPTSKLEVISISKNRSAMSLWVQEPTFSNASQVGLVQFSAIKLNPGYIGSKGNVLDIVFRVKDAGVANLYFSSGAILANDGRGSNLLTSFGTSVFTLTKISAPPAVAVTPTATAKPQLPSIPQIKYWIQDQNGKDVLFNTSEADPKWNDIPYAKLTWLVPLDVLGVASLLDDKPDSEPDPKTTTITDAQIFPSLAEGQHYFHLRFINSAGVGPTLHFPLLIDLHEPKSFSIEFTDIESNSQGIFSTSNPRPRARFFTEDILSGFSHYECKVNNGDWVHVDLERDGTFILPKLETEKRQNLLIRAYDNAGNSADASASLVVEPVVAPSIDFYPRNLDTAAGALIVDGRAAPGAIVKVVLTAAQPINLTVTADENGAWHLVYYDKLSAGRYSLQARQILNNGAESSLSIPVIIKVNLWSGKILDWLASFNWYLIIIIIFILIELLTLLLYRRFRAQNKQQRFNQSQPNNFKNEKN